MRAYLDHAATTPMRPAALEAFVAASQQVGNPSSVHTAGRYARRLVEEGRERLAQTLGAGPSAVVFTAGGTEADNLAITGLFRARRAADPRRTRLIISAVEHHAVLAPAEWLAEHEGAELVLLGVDRLGRVDPEAVSEAIDSAPGGADGVALVSVMWANSEVGTIQPVSQIVERAHARGVPVHSDAVQAIGQLPLFFDASGLDAISVSGHKLGGPIGIGALLTRRGLALQPVLHGGGQERQVRSGTLAAPSISAFSIAAEQAVAEVGDGRVADLRDRLIKTVLDQVPDAVLRGDSDPAGRLPANAHFTFPGCEGDSLLYLLDARGVECSTGSACQAGVSQPSHVLAAMGVPADQAVGALRFSLGWTSQPQDVELLGEAIGPAVARARRAAQVSAGDSAGDVVAEVQEKH